MISGTDFLDRLNDLLSRMARHPALHSAVEGDVRRALFRQFPYAVYYQLKSDTVHILAILHTSRKPDYWQSRDD
jgi:plasmid stabilization system protein ParE